jgi:hypothetical protein
MHTDFIHQPALFLQYLRKQPIIGVFKSSAKGYNENKVMLFTIIAHSYS